MSAIILTPAELATELSTDAKTTRKFLRDNARTNEMEIPGKGGRWMIEKRSVRSLKSRFIKWEAQNEQAKADRLAAAEARKSSKNETPAPAVQELTDEQMTELTEPTDDDLAEGEFDDAPDSDLDHLLD